MTKYKDILGLLGLIVSLAAVMIGLPKQIYTNYIAGHCKGLDKIFFAIVGMCYIIWTLYGYSIPDIYIIMSNVPGIFFIFIIYFQMWKYRKVGDDYEEAPRQLTKPSEDNQKFSMDQPWMVVSVAMNIILASTVALLVLIHFFP